MRRPSGRGENNGKGDGHRWGFPGAAALPRLEDRKREFNRQGAEPAKDFRAAAARKSGDNGIKDILSAVEIRYGIIPLGVL